MNETKKISELEILDKTLERLSYYSCIELFCEPINREEQKKLFLANKIVNPDFKYKELDFDPDEIIKELKNLKIPENPMRIFYKEKIEGLILSVQASKHINNPQNMRTATRKVYGAPNKETVLFAKKVLREIPDKKVRKVKGAEYVKKEIEKLLAEHGLDDWTVEFSDKYLTTVYPSSQRITICKDRKFSDIDPERLAVHEVGVHVLRSVNGKRQPYRILGTGLHGYLPTEEGLAFFCEQLTEAVSEEHFRDYAGRVIAIRSVMDDHTFRDTYSILRNYGFDQEQAWNLSFRTHRGGGLIKDHVYLEGYLNVRKLYENTEDFMYLYTGKIGVEHIPLVKKLIKKNILERPAIFPIFLRELAP